MTFSVYNVVQAHVGAHFFDNIIEKEIRISATMLPSSLRTKAMFDFDLDCDFDFAFSQSLQC